MSNLSQFGGGGIKSIQRGTVSVSTAAGSGTGTATITSVNTSKSVVSFLGFTPGSGFSGVYYGRVELTNATTVTATATGSASATVSVGYEVVEFY